MHKPCAIRHPLVVQPVVFGWQIGVVPLLSNHTKCGGTVTWSKQPCIFNDVGLLALCALVEGYPTSKKHYNLDVCGSRQLQRYFFVTPNKLGKIVRLHHPVKF